MYMSYNKLWKILNDRKILKKDLCKKSGISHTSLAKMVHNKNITTDVLMKICHTLDCDINDVMEFKDDIDRK